jgi:prevent-host-death family protein
MQQFNIYETKTHLSQLVDQASQGTSFIIAKSGKPLAKLVPLTPQPSNTFRFGTLQGKIKVADDFDAPLPDELLDLFTAKS